MDNVKRILVPIDSSEIAERAMQQAIKLIALMKQKFIFYM